MTRRRLVVLAVVVLLAACSDRSAPSASSAEPPAEATVAATDATTTIASSTVATTSPEAVIEVSTPPGAADAVGALDDVQGFECGTAEGRWIASGDVVNPTSSTAHYRIYVSYLDPDGETVGLIETDVNDVRAGARASWAAHFDSDATGVRCVLRVERFTA